MSTYMSKIYAALIGLAVAFAAPGEGPSNAFLQLPVNRHAVEARDFSALKRRALGVDIQFAIDPTYYTIDLGIGTPPQTVTLILGTDNSDTYVLDPSVCAAAADDFSSNNTLSNSSTGYLSLGNATCSKESVFESNKSSTFHSNATALYRYHSYAPTIELGEWAQDVMRLGDHNISNFNFAVANSSSTFTWGVAGVGLPAMESPFLVGDISAPYANLPQQLKQQGVIQHVAYSLWLNQQDNEAGSVLFGAIDHAKFTSDLYTIPFIDFDDSGSVTDFAIPMTGLSIYTANGTEQPFVSCSLPVVLDTSKAISSLPINYMRSFLDILNVTRFTDQVYVVPCDALSSKDGGLGIQLGGVDVTVGFSDLFVKVYTSDADGTEYCVPGFTISDQTYGPAIIGDNILKTLYVVYDLENLEVGIAAAQRGPAASSSSIQVLSTGIPGKRADKHLKSTMDSDSDLSWVPITVLKPSVTRPSDVATLPGIFTQGRPPYSSMSVPTSVTQTVVIGAKVDAKATKSSSDGASITRGGSLLAALAGLVLSLV